MAMRRGGEQSLPRRFGVREAFCTGCSAVRFGESPHWQFAMSDRPASQRDPDPLPLATELVIPPDRRILFFRRDRAMFGWLSHFHRAEIVLEGESWPSVEHFYQAQRSFDPAYRLAIRTAVSPGIAKRLAARPDAPRRISAQSWFRKSGQQPRPDWQEVKLPIMRRADAAKFGQHLSLAVLLLATGTAEIVEDSPFDEYWGLGPDGIGLNWAGRVLMEVRASLASPK
jgi:ribA/ribD-fused uncharacterized protein